MFIGTHRTTIDSKGRSSVPAPFRAHLGGADLVYVWRAATGPFLIGGGQALMEREAARIEANPSLTEEVEYLVFAEARPLKIEETGRISLPADLRAHANLEAEAAFAGMSSRFEIWNPAALEAHIVNLRARRRAS